MLFIDIVGYSKLLRHEQREPTGLKQSDTVKSNKFLD